MAKRIDNISDELLATFLDGNTSRRETEIVLDAISCDSRLQEFIELSEAVDLEMNEIEVEIEEPARHRKSLLSSSIRYRSRDLIEEEANFNCCYMKADNLCQKAVADDSGKNLCAIKCEAHALNVLGIDVEEKILKEIAIREKWLLPEGMPISCLGNLAERFGMNVERETHGTIRQIADALAKGNQVIAVVDGGELTGDLEQEKLEDIMIGEIPDHVVVITKYDSIEKTVSIYNPHESMTIETYGEEQFIDAWNDSSNYLVIISRP